MSADPFEEQRKLDARFAGGLAWTAGAKSATQVITWASTLAVARILFPADVGISAIAGIYTTITNVLAEFGVGTAVLHMPELTRKALGQLHLFSFLLCSSIFCVSILAAPLMAVFFRSDHVLFFAVNNIAFLFTGIQAVPLGLLQRDMDYRRLSLVEATSALTQAVVTVAAALLGWRYWSFTAGGGAGLLVATAMVSYWKPVPFAWPHWADIRKPVEMGRHVAISRVTASACGMADSIVVGRILGESALGSYRMAMNLASAPAEKVSMLVMRTASPLFANVVIVAPQAVPVLLGPRWTDATILLQWLGLFMIVRVLGVLAEQVLVSQRMTRLTMRLSLVNFAVMILAFYTAARWKGAPGVAASWILLSPLTILPLLVILFRKIELPVRDYAGALLPAVAGSAVMCLALLGMNRWLSGESWPVQVRLGVQIVTGGAVYAGFILCFFRSRVSRYRNFLANLKKGKETPVAAVL
jgi:PST family polysaccharide transporter